MVYARGIFRAVKCLSDFGIFYGYVTVDILDKLDFLGFKNAKSAHHVCKKENKNTADYFGIFDFVCTV